MTIDQKLQELHDRRLSALVQYGLLEIEREYWMLRAEKASRTVTTIGDADLTNITKGQISICYETADEAGRTLEELEAKAKAKGSEKISGKGLVAV